MTADGWTRTLEKSDPEIGVGDIVFCSAQPDESYFAHIVLHVKYDDHARENKYWIGNIVQEANGWCFRDHIYGILVRVQVPWGDQYHPRPHPKDNYERVKELVNRDGEKSRWDSTAGELCEPIWQAPLGRTG